MGIDSGTDAVRALLADAANGREIATAVFGNLCWMQGLYCDPEQNAFLQHLPDTVEGLESVVKSARSSAPDLTRNISPNLKMPGNPTNFNAATRRLAKKWKTRNTLHPTRRPTWFGIHTGLTPDTNSTYRFL